MTTLIREEKTRPLFPYLGYTVFLNLCFLGFFLMPVFFEWLIEGVFGGQPPALVEPILISVSFPFLLFWLFFGFFLFRVPVFFIGLASLLLVGSIVGFRFANLHRRVVQGWLVVIVAGYLLLPFLGQMQIEDIVRAAEGNQLVWVTEPSNRMFSMMRRYMSWAEYKGCEYELLGWEGDVLYYSAETCGIDGKNGTFSYSKTDGLQPTTTVPILSVTAIGGKTGQVDHRQLKPLLEFQGITLVGGYAKSEDKTQVAVEIFQPFSVHDIVILETK